MPCSFVVGNGGLADRGKQGNPFFIGKDAHGFFRAPEVRAGKADSPAHDEFSGGLQFFSEPHENFRAETRPSLYVGKR